MVRLPQAVEAAWLWGGTAARALRNQDRGRLADFRFLCYNKTNKSRWTIVPERFNMEILKKLYDKWERLMTTPFGVVFALNGWVTLTSWVLHWKSVHHFTWELGGLMTSCLIVYGFVKLIIWFAKDIKSLIADEFRYQVRAAVRQELKNPSRI